MSLKPSPIESVPEETARIARAAFRKGNPLLKLRNELGTLFADTDFADLFPRRGQPGLAPWPTGVEGSVRNPNTPGGLARKFTAADPELTDDGAWQRQPAALGRSMTS